MGGNLPIMHKAVSNKFLDDSSTFFFISPLLFLRKELPADPFRLRSSFGCSETLCNPTSTRGGWIDPEISILSILMLYQKDQS